MALATATKSSILITDDVTDDAFHSSGSSCGVGEVDDGHAKTRTFRCLVVLSVEEPQSAQQ